jgi:hypothetical protein
LNRCHDIHGVSAFLDVVNAHHLDRLTTHRVTKGGQGPRQSPFHRPIVEQPADESFPRNPQANRPAEPLKLAQSR